MTLLNLNLKDLQAPQDSFSSPKSVKILWVCCVFRSKLTWVWPRAERLQNSSPKETTVPSGVWSESGNSPSHLHPWGHMTGRHTTFIQIQKTNKILKDVFENTAEEIWQNDKMFDWFEIQEHNYTSFIFSCVCETCAGDHTWQEVMWWDGGGPTTRTPESHWWTASWGWGRWG